MINNVILIVLALFLISCMYVFGVSVHMSAAAGGDQKSVSDPLGLELQVNCPTEVLDTVLGVLCKTVYTLNLSSPNNVFLKCKISTIISCLYLQVCVCALTHTYVHMCVHMLCEVRRPNIADCPTLLLDSPFGENATNKTGIICKFLYLRYL